MSFSNYVDLEVEYIHKETADAFLVELPSGDEVWLPKSQIADPEDYEEGDHGLTISVTEWIKEQKGL